MRLRTILPSLPESLLDNLETIGIRTDADLLFKFPGGAMEVYQRLPLDTIPLAELSECIRQVVAHASAPVIRGDELVARESKRLEEHCAEDFLSGVTEIDEVMGGFGNYRVIEISGDKGVGKTALALQVVLRHLSRKPDSGALWIDTTGDFSAERIPLMLQHCTDASTPAADTAVRRLQVTLAFDVDVVYETLEILRTELASDVRPVTRYLVIDTVTTIFRPLLSVVSSQGHAMMMTFMRQLRLLAQTYPLSIIVVNGSSASPPHNPDSAFAATVRKPALGPSFAYMSDTTLWLAEFKGPKGEDRNTEPVYVAEILRSRSTLTRTWCTFKIQNGVLRSIKRYVKRHQSRTHNIIHMSHFILE